MSSMKIDVYGGLGSNMHVILELYWLLYANMSIIF